MSSAGTWQVKALGDLCEIARGGSPRPIQKFLTNDEDGINWIKISDATASSKYIYETKEKIRPEGAKRSRMVADGDFILSNSMSFGRPYIVKTSGCIHDGWLVLKDKSGLFDQDYLYHFLGSSEAYSQFDKLAAGSTVRNLNIDLVKKVRVTVPPIQEQKRIVSILDDAFERIDIAIANTEKNLANARELFRSVLTKHFNGTAEEYTSLGRITSDITDGDHQPPPKSNEGIPFITISNINKQANDIDFTDTYKVPAAYFKSLKPNRKPRVGDVLYTVTGSFGIPVLVDCNLEFCFQRHIGLLRPKSNVISRWLYYALMSPFVFRQAENGATGTAQKTVGLKVLREIRVPVMSQSQQVSVVSKLDNVWRASKSLESLSHDKLVLLQELKQSLLQKAFSGELTTDFNPDTLEQ